jgi:hypothetical protein
MNKWQCEYCKRVNDFSHHTCDGCGALLDFKPYEQVIYLDSLPMITTDGNGYISRRINGESVYVRANRAYA